MEVRAHHPQQRYDLHHALQVEGDEAVAAELADLLQADNLVAEAAGGHLDADLHAHGFWGRSLQKEQYRIHSSKRCPLPHQIVTERDKSLAELGAPYNSEKRLFLDLIA